MAHQAGSNRNGVVASVLAGLFLAALDQTIVSTSLPQIVTDLGGFNDYTWVIAAYLIALAVSAPVSARLAAQYGARHMFLASLGLFLLGSVFSGLSQSMFSLITGRAVQGLGAGGLVTGAFAVIGGLFVPRERLKWNALAGSVFSLASIVGPVLGGFITDHWSWQWIFFVNLPLGAVVALLASRHLSNGAPAVAGRIDWLGAVLAATTTTPFVLALLFGGVRYRWLSPQILGLLLLSIVSGTFFWQVERRAGSPILSTALFANRSMVWLCAVITLTSGVFFGAVLYIPLFLELTTGRSPGDAALLLLPLVVGVFVGSAAIGRIVHRRGTYFRVGALSLMLTVAALVWLSQLHQTTSGGTLAWEMLMLGLGLGPGMSLFQTIAQNLFLPAETGLVVGVTGFFRTIGGALGAAVLGSVFYSHLAAGLHRLPAAGITNPYLLGVLRDPNTIVTDHAPASLLGHITPQQLHQLSPAIEAYRGSAKVVMAGAIGPVFAAALVLAVIALVLYFGVEERELRS